MGSTYSNCLSLCIKISQCQCRNHRHYRSENISQTAIKRASESFLKGQAQSNSLTEKAIPCTHYISFIRRAQRLFTYVKQYANTDFLGINLPNNLVEQETEQVITIQNKRNNTTVLVERFSRTLERDGAMDSCRSGTTKKSVRSS